jgi:ribosomal protein S18 acetylase RimI-like enzyme
MQSATLPRLRTYRASDASSVEELARQAFGEYSPRAGAPSVRAATLPGTVAIVAELEGDPVGFAMTTFHRTQTSRSRARRHASLDAIAVDQAYRGRGIGKRLLAGALREAAKRRSVEIRLVTAESNVAALDLFLRSGFEIVERIARYYPKGQNAVVMKKKLA